MSSISTPLHGTRIARARAISGWCSSARRSRRGEHGEMDDQEGQDQPEGLALQFPLGRDGEGVAVARGLRSRRTMRGKPRFTHRGTLALAPPRLHARADERHPRLDERPSSAVVGDCPFRGQWTRLAAREGEGEGDERLVLTGLRVMIVEDEPLVMRRLLRLLKDRPAVEIVALAEHGRAALELLPATRPNLLLLDIAMPGIDGFDAARTYAGLARPGDRLRHRVRQTCLPRVRCSRGRFRTEAGEPRAPVGRARQRQPRSRNARCRKKAERAPRDGRAAPRAPADGPRALRSGDLGPAAGRKHQGRDRPDRLDPGRQGLCPHSQRRPLLHADRPDRCLRAAPGIPASSSAFTARPSFVSTGSGRSIAAATALSTCRSRADRGCASAENMPAS